MVDLSVPTEELLYNIESDHEELQFMHQVFAEILGGIIAQAQEVYVRDQIVKGLTAVATPGWDYLVGFNARAAAEEEAENDLAFWFEEDEI